MKSIHSTKNGVMYWISCIWLGLVCDLTHKREQAIEYYNELLNILPENLKKDFNCQFSQLNLFVDMDWLEERLSTPYTLKNK